MKTKLIVYALLAAAALTAAEPTPPPANGPLPTPAELIFSTSHAGMPLITETAARSLIIKCGSGEIKIDLRTGAVEISKDMPLDAAAVEFWKAIAAAFPGARKLIIEGEKK